MSRDRGRNTFAETGEPRATDPADFGPVVQSPQPLAAGFSPPFDLRAAGFAAQGLTVSSTSLAAYAATGPLANGLTVDWWMSNDTPGGVNVAAAWGMASGAGITVGVVDSAINALHQDLAGSVVTGIAPLAAGPYLDPHGTRVAGLIVGKIDNQIGGMGMAPEAMIVASQISYGAVPEIQAITQALQAQAAVDVSNNSWGFGQAFGDSAYNPALFPVLNAISQAVSEGRDGLGTAFVFAGGNGRMMIGGVNLGDDSNFHALTNSRQTIAVGAVDNTGRAALFSSPGTNLLLSAPGAGMVTADGLDRGATGQTTVAGTSFAAPLVSGTIALMLEVNPHLGYRDIQKILALTARSALPDQTPADGLGAEANAAHLLNGGGLVFDRDLGFGTLDAAAAVRLAAAWDLQSHGANEVQLTAVASQVAAADENSQEFLVDLPKPDQGFDLGWVELGLSVNGPNLRQMSIRLESPSGTVALIAPNLNALGSRTALEFDFTSAATWGETVEGTWRITLSLPAGMEHITVDLAELRFYGDAALGTGYGAEQHYFNNSFAALAAADPDRTIVRQEGGSAGSLIFAAMDRPVAVNLAAASGRIDGQDISLAGAFDRIVGGSADDFLRGRMGSETLGGGDGRDRLLGGGGADLLTGGRGADTLNGGLGDDVLRGGTGNDIYVVDALGDRVIDADPTTGLIGGGIDRVFSAVTLRLHATAGTRVVEHLTLTGTAAINGSGNALANSITGNAGNNVLNGRLGNDVMTGGAGRDAFVFNTALSASNVDRIRDFSVIDDTIRLEGALFTGLAPGSLAATAFVANQTGKAATPLERILYSTSTGQLSFDADGSGEAAPVQFASLSANLALTHADFIVF